jgi:hypothetical protein
MNLAKRPYLRWFRWSGRSFTLRPHASPDFVEEIHHQQDMTLGCLWLGAFRRHHRDDALAVGGEIELVPKPVFASCLANHTRDFSGWNEPSFTV